MIFDTAVIGAGATGAATAYYLSQYKQSCVLLESCSEVCSGISKANSGIVHGGFHHPADSLKTRLELRGNKLMDELQKKLHFPYLKCGILVVAYDREQLETLKKLFQRGIDNGVKDLEFCSRERVFELESKLDDSAVGGFFAPNGGTVEPYAYVFSLVECALKNHITLMNGFKVVKGLHSDGCWSLQAADGREIKARYVVNAAGLFADEVSIALGAENFTITPRKGEEYLLDRNCAGRPSRVIFPVPSPHSKGVLVIPTAGGTTMIGPTAELIDDKNDTATTSENFTKILSLTSKMIKGLSPRDLITSFAGLRPVCESEDFYIAPSQKVPAMIQAAGIQSPGLTASPAIGEYIVQLLQESGLTLEKKVDFDGSLPPRNTTREMSDCELQKAHNLDPAWANIICRCEEISEAEIIEAVKRGHTTVDGVKFYTRAGMGRCQGGFCTAKVLEIISRESGIPATELTKRGKGSRILAGKLGDFEVK
ncbi:MAG: NAD(P)/FAD-dependent oxidoreductase [Lentisphaerae bacterium]|nr:NAD(P)/FAD-dependent oxidoreductase [Lentisphaerota bacterium]